MIIQLQKNVGKSTEKVFFTLTALKTHFLVMPLDFAKSLLQKKLKFTRMILFYSILIRSLSLVPAHRSRSPNFCECMCIALRLFSRLFSIAAGNRVEPVTYSTTFNLPFRFVTRSSESDIMQLTGRSQTLFLLFSSCYIKHRRFSDFRL